MARQVTLALLDKIQDGFNQHDVDAIFSSFATDRVWLMASDPNETEGRRYIGKEEIGPH